MNNGFLKKKKKKDFINIRCEMSAVKAALNRKIRQQGMDLQQELSSTAFTQTGWRLDTG